MEIYVQVESLQKRLKSYRAKGKSIGFSPTMGALHEGHASLITTSQVRNDISICSIFVNPTQFNNKKDLEKYPRTQDADINFLKTLGCDILFSPDVQEIYPEGLEKFSIDLNGLDEVMEGSQRPGHFDGVVQVVKRLLDIVKPDHLYMGQKDFQQFSIIHYMIKSLEMKTKLAVCPIVREADGLAMSSRNVRLSEDVRLRASIIYKTLQASKDWLKYIPVKYTIEKAMNALDIYDFYPEYFEIVDGNTLQPIDNYRSSDYAVACTAVWAGGVRLIDNVIYKQKH